jgi:hypothetical protein
VTGRSTSSSTRSRPRDRWADRAAPEVPTLGTSDDWRTRFRQRRSAADRDEPRHRGPRPRGPEIAGDWLIARTRSCARSSGPSTS